MGRFTDKVAIVTGASTGLGPVMAKMLAGLEALGDQITSRTAWLIEHHMEAHGLLDGTLGARARRRLAESEDFETLKLLARCDRGGRQRGVDAPDLDEALEFLRDLAATCGE